MRVEERLGGASRVVSLAWEVREHGGSTIAGVKWGDKGKSDALAALSGFHQHPQFRMFREGPRHHLKTGE